MAEELEGELLPATVEETSLVEAPQTGLIMDEGTVEQLEKAVALKKRMMTAVLKLTTKNDWLDQNGRPYLQASGAEALADAMGITWRTIDKEIIVHTDAEGKRIDTTVFRMEFTKGKRTITVEGIASTDDDFFARRKDGQGGYYYLPYDEVDRNSVRKKAETNGIERGVTKILGIRGITWEDLKEAGITQGNIGSVAYKGGGGSNSQPSGPVDPDVRNKLWNMLMDLASGDEAVAKAGCKKYSGFTGKDGKETSFDDPRNPKISDKWVMSTYGKVKNVYEEKGF